MFPTFIGILDIQSWWEVPSIAHFCSLFRDAFNLLDFDIEDLEEALLTDSGIEGHLLQELIVRLLEGCLSNDSRNDISTFNYQMFLRRLFRKKCQEYKCENPFNTDVDFELLPLRQKVEILRDLCDFRLDAEDVEESLNNLDSDSLRVEPLGHDRKNSAYWYFYGTRLYREDYVNTSNSISQKQKSKSRDKRRKRCRCRLAKEKEKEKEKEEDCLVHKNKDNKESIWQVVCFTLQDWSCLVEKFKDSDHATERKLYKTLSEDFMPEIPKLFDLKEKQQRRKILQRSSSRTVQSHASEDIDEPAMVKSKIKTKTNKGKKKSANQTSKNVKVEEEIAPPPIQKKGRQTNNSLASAVGQIVIDTRDEVIDIENKKGTCKLAGSISSGYRYGYNFGIEEEEQQVGMHKVLKILKDHEDAWPFTDPVDEQYAPRYYSVVRRPMDLKTMEDKLEEGSYKTISQFKRDFRLIIDNCRQYNGSDNEYTEMAMNLKEVFHRAVDRYLESEQSSDDSLSGESGVGVNSPGYKCKSLQSTVRHSQRYKHSRKLNKNTKLSSKVSKKKTRQRAHDDSAKEESEVETKVVKVKDKKGRKKAKKCKNDVNVEENNEEQENESAISDVNVIKSKKKKTADLDRTVSKNTKICVKEEVDKESVKSNKKNKKELRPDKESRSSKELKENRKRKDDFEEDYNSVSIPKNKSRKIEKKESKELDVLIDRVRKSKVKKEESQDPLFEEDEKLSSSINKGKKNRKINKDNTETSIKYNDKEKDKKSKKTTDELLKNGELKDECDVKNIECTDTNKTITKKIESLVTNKDIESLDSLKDRISERRREEKLKLEQEKKKKQSSKSDSLHRTSKKVPSNGSTYHHDVDKLSGKKLKSKKVNKEEKSNESKSQNQDESEPKKIKTSYSKHTKGSGRGDPAIQALNQATEQTLNDINKWLDDAPRLSEFSSGSDSPVFPATTRDTPKPVPNKQVVTSTTITTATTSSVTVPVTTSTSVTTTAVTTTTDAASRKRPSSIKLFGPHASVRPKKVQRTIDRLQPGKSKGNLLSKKPPTNDGTPVSDTAISQSNTENNQPNRETNDEPKLSLGTVLKNVESIQLICKSIVSSPNPNLSNDEDDEDVGSKPATPLNNLVEEQPTFVKKDTLSTNKDEKNEKRVDSEETQKIKSATPNLSAWFKAFGAPKSKKKEEETATSTTIKKEEISESSSLSCGNRQRRMSTGGSSVSESVSSFSQESPPSRTGRSPQQSQQSLGIMPSPAAMEPQIRGAGFYQDALSTGSSPYNSPYYTTPPRYSAQLPPTPSPQHHPLSPAYPSSAVYDQAATQAPPSIYSQISPQTSHQSFQKSSPQAQSPTFSQQSPQGCFSQNSPQSEQQQSYTASPIVAAQNQSPVYTQQSPQALQSAPYPQPSPQPANYSQPSPQTQPLTPGYSQPSPQTPANNYSQPSPSQAGSLNFSQSSPQQQNSPYSQSSPQPPPNYSQSSPQSQQHSPYSQPSPQQPNYSQVSSRPPSTTYSQPSPQPPGYTAQTPSPYSQPDLVIAQASPQARGYSQTSPQQPPPSYSQSSPQTPSPYSAQPSPQQQPPTYSQPSPQTPPSYSQPSPQQTRAYSHPSPQQTSQQQQSVSNIQQQQMTNYSQSSPQQSSQQQQQPQLQQQQPQQQQQQQPQPQSFIKTSEDCSQNLSTSSFNQPIKSAYLQSSTASTPIVKPAPTKEKQLQQHQQSAEQHLVALNQQVYQSASGTQYPPTYPTNVFSGSDRMSSQLSNETISRSTTSRLTNHETHQIAQTRQVQQTQDQQSQLLSFQQNLATHESLYSSSFQAPPYPMPNAACRSVYPGYFDTSTKSMPSSPSPSNNLAPVKKRMYNEPPTAADATTQRPVNQDQFGFDSLMALAHSQSDVSVPNQFDSAFASSLADSVASNPAYARLQLGLVGRSTKETQQLLSIPRPSSKNDSLTSYARTATSGQSELDLNLLQSLQNAAAKGSGMLSMSRRVTEQPAPVQPVASTKSKKSKKSKQQQQQQQLNVGVDQQTGIPGFPQYGSATNDPIGLKQSTVGGSAFNFAASAGPTNSSPFYDKEASASAAAAAYAFLDDFRNPNLPSYYSMALRQQQQQQAQQQQQQAQQQATPVSDAAQQACNKLTNQTAAARNYSSHPFLHSTQRPTPYGPPVPPYVTPHGANLGVDPAAYQQYLHSLYALQPPPHHRPTWL